MLTLILSFSLLPRVSFNAFNSVSVYTLSKNDACVTLNNIMSVSFYAYYQQRQGLWVKLIFSR